jgi:hypothetical protein
MGALFLQAVIDIVAGRGFSASANGPVYVLEIPFSVCAERLDSICAGL